MADLNVALILGSGNSLAAGMPTISEITEKLLNPRDVFSDEFGHFSFETPTVESYNDPELVATSHNGFKLVYESLKSSRLAWKHVEQSQRSDVNYEEVYYALREAHAGSDYGMVIREMLDNELSKEYSDEHERAMVMFQAITYGFIYTEHLVGAMLSKKPEDLHYLEPLVSLVKRYPNLQVCDLNHDTVFMQALKQSDIKFSTGFAIRPPYNWSEWDRQEFESASGIRIIKPHGCIDWLYQFLYHLDGERFPEIRVLNLASDRALHTPDSTIPPPSYPLLIIGTDNKLKEYTYSIFRSMQRVLDQSIMAADVIICSGYGFGDFGINQVLLARLSRQPSCKFILIDPKAKELVDKVSRDSIINWRRVSGQVISKKIQDVSWDELKNAIQSTPRIIFEIVKPGSDTVPFTFIGA